MTDINTNSVFSHYEKDLLPVVEEVCGDTAALPLIEEDFRRYLSRTSFGYETHAAVRDLTATGSEAGFVLRRFLSNGSNCPDESITGQSRILARSFETGVKSIVTLHPDGELTSTHNPKRVYDTWYRFLALYMKIMGEVNDAAESILAQDNLDFTGIQNLKNAIRRSEIAAKATDSLKNGDISSSPEGKIVLSHFQKINNLRVPVQIASTMLSGPPEYLSETAEGLARAYGSLHDPFEWIKKVVMHFTRSFENSVDVIIPNDPPKLKYNNPLALWKLMDTVAQMAVETTQNGNLTSIKFYWDYFKRHFVISFAAKKSSERFTDLESHAARLNALMQISAHSGEKQRDLAAIEIRVPFKSGAPESSGNENPSGAGGPSASGEDSDPILVSAETAGSVNVSAGSAVYGGFNCQIPIFAPPPNAGTMPIPALLHV